MQYKQALGVLLTAGFALVCGGCGANSGNTPAANPAPLTTGNINLIFVASEDLAYHAPNEVSLVTANLTSQGLQRSLLMATFLQQNVLEKQNVTGIYALEPMTHLQTADNYPDMSPLETIQQFSVLNQISLSSNLVGGAFYTGNNVPVYASYSSGSVPSGVVVPSQYCPNCQGLDFNDKGSDNEDLLTSIIATKTPGFYLFSAPWETTSSMLANLNKLQGFNLSIPASYKGPNYIYAISIPPSGSASLATFNGNVNPPSTYPVPPPPALVSASCASNTPPSITLTGGVNGAVIPAGINTNETLYIVRHAEAHPQGYWSDNNYVGAGQWRALDLPNSLLGKISPNQVWSGDPAQFSQGTTTASGEDHWSILVPAMTVEPYAIANDLPYHLVTSFQLTDSNVAAETSSFFFTNGTFSNQKILLGWSYVQIDSTVNALLASYFPNGGSPTAPVWASTDYDSLWTLTLDAQGNLAADFTECEGIDSSALPPTAPQF